MVSSTVYHHMSTMGTHSEHWDTRIHLPDPRIQLLAQAGIAVYTLGPVERHGIYRIKTWYIARETPYLARWAYSGSEDLRDEIWDLGSDIRDLRIRMLSSCIQYCTVLYIVLYIGSVHRGNPPLDVDSGEYTCQTGESLCSEEILRGDIWHLRDDIWYLRDDISVTPVYTCVQYHTYSTVLLYTVLYTLVSTVVYSDMQMSSLRCQIWHLTSQRWHHRIHMYTVVYSSVQYRTYSSDYSHYSTYSTVVLYIVLYTLVYTVVYSDIHMYIQQHTRHTSTYMYAYTCTQWYTVVYSTVYSSV